jgi:hypothetical protein
MRTALILAALLAALPVARAETPAAAAVPAAAPAPSAPPTVEDLVDIAHVKAVCLATRPPDRVYFDGDAVAVADALAKYKVARTADLARLYRARVPPQGFKLGTYDASEGELSLDLSAPPPTDAPVEFKLTEAQAAAVSAAAQAGRAQLVAYFELNDDQGAVCTGSAAAGVFTIAAEPVAFEIRDAAGTSLARAEMARAEQYRALIGGYSGTPEVVLGSIQGDSPDAVSIARRLTPTRDVLKACYTERLRARTDAGGSAVISVSIKEGGQVEGVTFIADALDDDVLRKCVESTFRGVSFDGVQGLPTTFRVPVELRLSSQK